MFIMTFLVVLGSGIWLSHCSCSTGVFSSSFSVNFSDFMSAIVCLPPSVDVVSVRTVVCLSFCWSVDVSACICLEVLLLISPS